MRDPEDESGGYASGDDGLLEDAGSDSGSDCRAASSIFPRGCLHSVVQDLQKPAWVINFAKVIPCIDRSITVFRYPRSPDDKHMVEQFASQVLRDIVQKAVAQQHHLNWTPQNQAEVLNMTVLLAALSATSLATVLDNPNERWGLPQDDKASRKVEIVALYVDVLSWVFSDQHSFAHAFEYEPIPAEASPLVKELLALAKQPIPGWPTLVALKFGSLGGWYLLFQALQELPFELSIADKLLAPVASARSLLVGIPAAEEDLLQAGGVDVLQQLLRKVHELLDADNLLVLAQENDHTYLCLSRFFQKLLDVAKLFLQPSEAEALVHDTHCRFLEKMLSRRSFNTMRALVREVNSRLCRARRRDQNEDSPSADAKLVPVLEFLETRNVVEELLTVNMHQWQYVESLQQLLTTLAEVHALSKKTLRSLWGQLRQDGVVDVVKVNVASLLGRVIKVADPELLQELVSSLDIADVTSANDVRTVFELFPSIYTNPRTPSALVFCCLDFGWKLLTSQAHTSYVIPSFATIREPIHPLDINHFGDSVIQAEEAWLKGHGAASEDSWSKGQRNSPAGVFEFADKYTRLCLDSIQACKALPAVLSTLHFLLHRLCIEDTAKVARACLPSLGEGSYLLRLVITSLCTWMSEASKPPLPQAFYQIFHRYLQLILMAITLSRTEAALHSADPCNDGTVIPKELVSQLWDSTVSALPTVKSPDATDAELSYEFFRQLCSLGAVRPAALEHLVSDPRRHRPPRSITYESLRHLFQVIVLVNLELGRIQETPESLLPDAPKYEVAAGGRPLVGFDYIFEVLVSTLDELVATSAATQLVQVYVQPYSAFGRSYPSWKTFIVDVVNKLTTYARHLCGAAPDVNLDAACWRAFAERGAANTDAKQIASHGLKAQRVLRMLAHVLSFSHGRNMPFKRPHRASIRGFSVDFPVVLSIEVAASAWKPHPMFTVQESAGSKRQILVHTHSTVYIADLRAYLASSLGLRPGEVRLFSMGKEYDDDSLQLADLFSSVVEKLSFHMHKVKLGLHHVSSQPQAVQDLVAKSCPDVLMAQHPTLTATLIYLLDFPVREHGAHSTAYAVLARLETSPELLRELQQAPEDVPVDASADGEDTFAPAVCRVLNTPVPQAGMFQQRPGALLYTLEAILALMQPTTSCTPGPLPLLLGSPSTAMLAIIAAVEANAGPRLKPHSFWTHFYATAIALLKALACRAHLGVTAEAPEASQTTPNGAPANVDQADTSATPTKATSREASSAPSTDRDPIPRSCSPAESLGSSGDGRNPPHAHSPDPVLSSPSAAVLQPHVMLRLAAFWLKLAKWLSQALAVPEGCEALEIETAEWAAASRHGDNDSTLLSSVLQQINKILWADDGANLSAIVSMPGFAALVQDMLFHPHEVVRKAGLDLASTPLQGPPHVQLAILQMLLEMPAAADHERHTTHFFEAPEKMLAEMSAAADHERHTTRFFEALEKASRVASEALAAPDALALHALFLSTLVKVKEPHVPSSQLHSQPSLPDSERLAGRLKLLGVLWQVLSEHESSAHPGCAGPVRDALCNPENVRFVLDDLLFPEAAICVQLENVPDHPTASLQAALQPRCPTPEARAAAYDLLKSMVASGLALMMTCLRGLLLMLAPGPTFSDTLQQQYALHLCALQGNAAARDNTQCRYVGLKSAGATCYMNAVLQQLFMQPTIRTCVLRAPQPESTEAEVDALFAAVQITFAHLAVSTAPHFAPKCMWESLRDIDGNHINVHVRPYGGKTHVSCLKADDRSRYALMLGCMQEHEDAHEFLHKLQTKVDAYGPNIKAEYKPMSAAMGGVMVTTFTCSTVDYQSRTIEPFAPLQICVDVQNMGTLERALDVYFQEELMEGDNAYFCEAVGRKVPCIKRSLVERLPHTFVILLKRFEYDYVHFMRVKIFDRFEFPAKLNMHKYTPEGAAGAGAPDTGDASMSKHGDYEAECPAVPRSYYEYELKGVVVHSGNAGAGHYYSFVRERGPDGKWFCFDDTSVTPWDPAFMDECCFGGPSSHGDANRPNSAFMLVYERSAAFEPVDICPELLDPPLAKPEDVNLDAPAVDRAVSHPLKGMASSESISAVDAAETPRARWSPASTTDVPYGMPQELYAQIMQENLALEQAAHLTAPQHTAFVRHILAECLQLHSSSDCHDVRHSMATGSAATGVKTSSSDGRAANALKRLAVAPPPDGGSSPTPRTRTREPPHNVDLSTATCEDLATLLAAKYVLSTLVFIPVDDAVFRYFVDSVESGVERHHAVPLVLEAILASVMHMTSGAQLTPLSLQVNAFLHADTRVRDRSCTFVLTVLGRILNGADVTGASKPDSDRVLQLVCDSALSYCICRHLWRLVTASYQAFQHAHDSLLDLLYRMALIRPLRDIFDQIIPDNLHQHPLRILVQSWPFLTNSRGRVNIHAARAFWMLLRTLCCVLPSPVPMEQLTIRHALSAGATPADFAKQDVHLRAALPVAELRALSLELQQLSLASSKTLYFLADCLERSQQMQHPADDPNGVASLHLARTICVICEDIFCQGVEDQVAMRILNHLLHDYFSIVSPRELELTVTALVNGDPRIGNFAGLWALLEDRTNPTLADSIMLKQAITVLILGVHDQVPSRLLSILGNPPSSRARDRVMAIENVFNTLYSARSPPSVHQPFHALHGNARQIMESGTAAQAADDPAAEGGQQESPPRNEAP